MTYRLFDGKESVTHPPAGGSVPADVREASLVVPVWCAKGDLLDGLVDDEASGLVVHHAKPVAAHVQHRFHALALGCLKPTIVIFRCRKLIWKNGSTLAQGLAQKCSFFIKVSKPLQIRTRCNEFAETHLNTNIHMH